jgi:RHS repeat-associated protein
VRSRPRSGAAEPRRHDNRFRTYDPGTGRYVSADPIGQRAATNLYAYVYSNPLRWGDPLGLKTRFYVSHDESSIGTSYGSHVSSSVDNPGEGQTGPTLYDPSGGYKANTRGSGGIVGPDEGFSESNYFDYLAKTGSTSVTIITFNTNPDQEAALMRAAGDVGDPRGVWCSTSVSAAAKQSGAFPGLEGSFFPGELESQLSALPGASVTTLDLRGRAQRK